MRTLWQVLAIGCGIFLTILWGPVARAENITDKAIRAVLNQQVNLDCDRESFQNQMKRLAEALNVPIEIDTLSTQLEGLTLGNAARVQSGSRSAKELLELAMYKFGRDCLSFIIVKDEENRSPLGHKIVIVSHAYIEQRGWIVPPSDEAETAIVLAERLDKRINVDVERDTPAGHWQRLSEAIEIPIDVDEKVWPVLDSESKNGFPLAVGTRTAREILDWTISLSTGRTAISYTVAEDPRQRFAHQLRIVIAPRTTITTNPARFSLPRRRPTAKPLYHNSLNELVTLQIANTPLRESLSMVAKQGKVVILFDELELKRTGISLDEPISIAVTDQPLGQTVKQILDQAGGTERRMAALSGGPDNRLVFAILYRPSKPDELFITTRKAADKRRLGLADVFYVREAPP